MRAVHAVVPTDIRALEDQLAAVERDAAALVAGLSAEQAGWRPEPGAWSVAECLDHLAAANRAYLAAMAPPAVRAREQGRWRRGPATPGFVGRWFMGTLEPPPRPLLKLPAPRMIRPRPAPPFAAAYADFQATHSDAVAFLRANADLDLAHVGFANPFVRGVRFSLATGLHVIAAHERRHLWQAWRVRKAAGA